MALLDDFAGTGALNTSNWNVDASCRYTRSSDQCIYQAGAYNHANWKTAFTDTTQHAQLKIVTISTDEYTPGPCVRGQSTMSGDGTGYAANAFAGGYIRLYRNSATISTSDAGAISNGQTLKIVAVDSGANCTVTVYVDGTKVTSGGFASDYTDTSKLTGQYIGMYCYGHDTSAPTSNWIVDDFAGGDGTGAGASAAVTQAGHLARMMHQG